MKTEAVRYYRTKTGDIVKRSEDGREVKVTFAEWLEHNARLVDVIDKGREKK